MLAGAPSLLANLKYIVDQTGASIVLSSTWRVEEATKDAVATRLSSVGLKLVGCTPELIELEPPDSHATLCEGPDGDFLFGRERAIEILRWLKAEGAADADFVALDDMDLHGPAGVGLHARNFVRTEDMYGLTRLRAETAVARFFALESQRHAAARQGAAAPSVEGDECLCASRRFDFRPPSGERDEAVHALFNDEETMLPYLPMLCPMSRSALERRRAEQRLGMARGTSCFMDILDRTSGELVGTAGFRSVVEGHAEFGIVVHREWQRAGVCRESFVANAVYAAETLDCAVIAAATLETNGRARAFLAKAGLKHVRTQSDHGLEWMVHEARIDELPWADLASPARASSRRADR